ncbi:hypothetical protein I7I50_04373 [Histoplasma capsulatum G186AR]|uniref:CorA family metal ion transporter n=1 Tax=Ajellomyces capsulatus TaxID=5037 RepID=A0A8H7YMJ6_AJECA|nr:hypothetical protein I7I52_05281 [Histoplasma capsulatum]QSS75283.1 hypothetical protein I7I50_04373 [Histoplasma capsulatum G186AR]
MGDSASPHSSAPPPTTGGRPQPRLDTRNLGSLPPNDHVDIHGPHSPAPSPRVAEEFSTVHEPYRRFGTRHTQKHDLGPKWHKEYSEIDVFGGRVLIIDFVKQDDCKVGMRKVAAQEIYDLEHLRRVYTNQERNDEAVLRVFHVQNAEWATNYLLRKFNIDNRDDLVGTNFGRYVRHRRPERRGGKPFLSGKTWKVQYDPWRGISKTSFGLDYFKQHRCHEPTERKARARHEQDDSLKMMELNCFDENDNPKYGYDVYVQRVSCYIQHKQTSIEVPTNPDIKNPYIIEPAKTDSAKNRLKNEYIPRLNTLDNGNAILIFDNSHNNSIEDTLIGARGVWESRWRRLPFFLAFESRDLVATDEQLAFQCSRIILEDIFKALVLEWDAFLDLAMDHVSILEDKIYEEPADETRAPELWLNSSIWLKVEKLLFIHIDIIKEMRPRLRELDDDLDTDDTWLDSIPGDYDRLSTLVEEDLVKPTKTLISLLYQSVSIRDSRHSIQLGVSMWRLSWITFIFLPLTFIVGFFGMNVDTFADNPSIKWYFISCVPFMLCVLAAWYVVKHIIARQRQTPYQRGIYENFFHEMATENPSLWSRMGPREYVRPEGHIARLKWHLVKRWSAPERTILASPKSDDEGVDSLGAVSKLKRYLICRWTAQIAANQAVDPSSASSLEAGQVDYGIEAEGLVEGSHVVAEGLAEAAETLVIPATPVVEGAFAFEKSASQLPVPATGTHGGEERLSRIWSRRHLNQNSNSSDNRSSGILVEEEDFRWLSEQGKEGKRFKWRSSSSRDRSEARKEMEAGEDEADKENKQEGNASGTDGHGGAVTSNDNAGEQSPEETHPKT